MFKFTKNSKSNNESKGLDTPDSPRIEPWGDRSSEVNSSDIKLQSLLPTEATATETTQPNHPADKQAKQPRRNPKQKSKSRFWIWFLSGMILGASTSGFALYRGWQELEALVPAGVDDILTYTRPETLTVKASDGTVIEEIGPVTHDKVKIWQIPEMMTAAFIASEDRRFYDHFGVDVQGVARAAYVNFQAGQVVEGGSSITQQVARIVFLNQEVTAIRKLKEMRLATKLEERFEKDQILESYLNLVYLGSGAYGVADAAWVYFGKSIEDLTIAESAMIAGLAPAPSVYSPFVNPEAALARRNIVLQRMQEDGIITPQEADKAIATPIETNRQPPKRLLRKYPYFSDYVQQQLKDHLTPEQFEAGGIVVETTLNPQWQEVAQKVVEEGVARYGRYQRFQQAALVSVDPRNGQIKAMVGGIDFENNQYNRVTQAQRQPGSTFKTFVYTAAIAAGKSPYTPYPDKEFSVDGYKPQNYSKKYSGQEMSINNALTQSINTVAVRAMIDVGWDPTINLAQRMGIHSELKPTYSLALGASEVNLLELTSAYGTLANKGVYQPTYGISRILDRNGKVLYQAPSQPLQAIDPTSASIMNWMLQSVVTVGTGRQAYIGRPVAGKTGTSDQSRDLWFVGYIPQLVTGVWLGNDDNKPTWGNSSTAAQIWSNLMKLVVVSLPVESFPPLPNLSSRKGSIEAQPLKNAKIKQKKTESETKKSQPKTASQSKNTSNTNTKKTSSSTAETQSSRNSKPSGNTPPKSPDTRSEPANSPSPKPNQQKKTSPPPNTSRQAEEESSEQLPSWVPEPETSTPAAAPAPTAPPSQPKVAPPSPPAVTKPASPPAKQAPPPNNPSSGNDNIPAPPAAQKKTEQPPSEPAE